VRETLPRPTDLPHTQCQLPQAIATLTTIEESITDTPSSCSGSGKPLFWPPCPNLRLLERSMAGVNSVSTAGTRSVRVAPRQQ
jgi:hypothetical protein